MRLPLRAGWLLRARSEPEGYGCRAEASCVGRQRTQEKILRQRIVEIVGDESHNRFDPALPLEFLDRFETKTLARTVRRELENGRAVARDDNRLPPFDLPGE